MVLGKLFGHLLGDGIKVSGWFDKLDGGGRVHEGGVVVESQDGVGSLKGSHRVLLRIIHAIVFDAHHVVWNRMNKEGRAKTYTEFAWWSRETESKPVRTKKGGGEERQDYQPYQYRKSFELHILAHQWSLSAKGSTHLLNNHGSKAETQGGFRS